MNIQKSATNFTWFLLGTWFACAAATAAETARPVTLESLLDEMVEREAVARFPEPDFRLRQASSYNRASKTPDDPGGWFNNKDNNTSAKDKNFIRVEENGGRREWVLMDDKGPGAIVRSWMPWRGQAKPTTTSIIRFYLDGAAEPAIEGNMFGLFQGKGLVPFPLAHESLRSAVSFFPIPYARSCKVTVTELPFFYQFTYREYPDGTPVQTFRMKDFKAASATIDATCKALLGPQDQAGARAVAIDGTLAPKDERSVDLPAGTGALRTLSVKLGSYADPAVTRSVVLKMSFDGKETVWCPVGDFFGTGIGLHPFQGWFRTVAEDGTMSCRWVMPYRESGRISIINLGDEAVEVDLDATVGDWKWDDRSMYFHAAWRGQYPVPTRPYSDWNYVTLKGRGVYVGDTLTIMNPVERWWGEGDEKIFVDGESFPSIFGTGTEDYYAYSWGGRSTDFYEHPFHAQPRCNQYDKRNRKTSDERNTQGYSTETRTRALDTMPFGSSLQLDMEVWSWTDCDMGYGVGAYWYGDADTSSNRVPDPEGALRIPPVPEVGAKGADSKPAPANVSSFSHAIECEKMKVVAKSDGLKAAPQDLGKIKGKWSASSQVLARAKSVGEFVELRIPNQGPGAANLVLHATKSHDFGIIRFTVNGKSAGPNVDLFARKPKPSGPIPLGAFDPVDNAYVLRAEVVGKNPQSKGFFFGLDCVVKPPVEKASKASTQAEPPQEERDKPFVVVIMADDLDYDDYEWLKGTRHYKAKRD